ncbi:MAG: TonB-dependent receptor plug domain-containing protein, partial [Gammaproteobacteria bacterium]|nr:TonB-dependent receptor plug domain-containing protein [Gammaproteobacteria bacterium]
MILIGAFVYAVVPSLYAEPSVDSSDEVVKDLLKTLEKETQRIVEHKINQDFVPGIISILHSSDLQYLGVRTVNEALVFLPGIESSIAADGQVQLIIRGTGKVFSSGKIKFLLNHIPQNSVLNGANAVGLLPIEFVERIEVIRGPGSATYGEYAFTGVVNIITKKYSSLAYAHSAYPSHQYAGLLLAKQFRTSKRPLNTNISFSMEVNKGDSIKAGEDF